MKDWVSNLSEIGLYLYVFLVKTELFLINKKYDDKWDYGNL